MVTGKIKFGAIKELSRKPLPCDQLGSFFFYGGQDKQDKIHIGLHFKASPEKAESCLKYGIKSLLRMNTARHAPNFTDNICRRLCVKTLKPLNRFFGTLLRFNGIRSKPSASFNYNVSQKRVTRQTNILHTGATLSGVGEERRLRKGFLPVDSGLATSRAYLRQTCQKVISRGSLKLTAACLHAKSLFSVAEISCPVRNMTLW